MKSTQINKRIADMQYCMRQEADKALDNDASYRTCKDKYNNAVMLWLADKSAENDNAMQESNKSLRAAFDVVVEPINNRCKARMTQLYNKKLKLESK